MTKDMHHIATEDRLAFGFWIYILSDCVLFAALFATYAVQQSQIFTGPTPSDIFSLQTALIETLLLLTSSFTCGLAVLFASSKEDTKSTNIKVFAMLGLTLLLGLSFVALELREFGQLLADGHSWQQSSFLSSFFTLVGTHGLHVSLGMLWMLVLAAHIYFKGLTQSTKRKLVAFSIFWHFLDIIWIFIFTFVYMSGIL